MNVIFEAGLITKEFIILCASFLLQDYVPGLVALLLIIGLFGCVGWYVVLSGRRIAALRELQQVIASLPKGANFSDHINTIDQQFEAGSKKASLHSVATAWSEYRETMILYGDGENQILRNSVRPAAFFNVEDLQFGPGFFRIVPGLFVSVGLFLTFLGLIAALGTMHVEGDPAQMREGLANLLKAASAKFTMSLTGLFCSIIFTAVLRYGMNKVDRAIHATCHHIERRLSFISLEDIAVDQLSAMKEQREHFRTIGLELVEMIARPMREDLPRVISQSISEAISPVMQQVQQAGTAGLGTMVEDLSSRFSNDVGQALATASKSLEVAGDRFASLSERIDINSGTMNREVEGAILRIGHVIDGIRGGLTASAEQTQTVFSEGTEKLLSIVAETLQDIRTNTGEGARAIAEAAGDMKAVAQTFRSELAGATQAGVDLINKEMTTTSGAAQIAWHDATKGLISAFGQSSESITNAGQTLADKFAQDVLAPVDELVSRLTDLNLKVAVSNDEMRKLSDGVQAGALASEAAAATFRTASGDLVAAANPVRGFAENIARSIADLKSSSDRTAETLHRNSVEMVEAANAALHSASALLGGEQRAIEAALVGVGEAVNRMKDQGQRLDDIDSKLEAAFRVYSEQVKSAIDLITRHVQDMQKEFGPAIDTMRDIVEQSEKFSSVTRVGR